MADVQDLEVHQEEPAVPEKEVEDDAPKVVDDEITSASVVENGKSGDAEPEAAADAAPENGSTEAEPEVTSTPAAEEADDAAEEAKNGESTDAPAEAVKRKIPAEADATDAAVTDDVSPTPEKKSKLEEAAKENGSAAAEAEVVA